MYFNTDTSGLDRDWNAAKDDQSAKRPGPTKLQQHRHTLKSIIQIFGFEDNDDDEAQGFARSCCNWFKSSWSNEDSVVRRMIAPVCLVVYSFIGGGIFYAIEMEHWDFWACVFYSNTLITTIGYGIVYPHTYGGRWFTILYSLIGIPMAIITVSDVGYLLAKWLGRGWRGFKKLITPCLNKFTQTVQSTKRSVNHWRHRNDVVPINKDNIIAMDAVEREKKQRASLMPFPLALAMCFLWLLLSTLYFESLESWSYFDAFYFTFVSVATIGLGDLTPSSVHSPRLVPDFVFVIIGIALFSMCLNVVQYELEHISISIAEQIMAEYAAALNDGHSLDLILPVDTRSRRRVGTHGRVRVDHLEGRRYEEWAARAAIRRLLRKKAGWLRFLVGKTFEDRLLSEYQKRAKMRLASTQTEIETRDVCLMVHPEGISVFTSTSATEFNYHRREIQRLTVDLATREREAIAKHVKRISESYGALLKELSIRRAAKRRRSSNSWDTISPNTASTSSKLSSIDENSTDDLAASFKSAESDQGVGSMSSATSSNGPNRKRGKAKRKKKKKQTEPNLDSTIDSPPVVAQTAPASIAIEDLHTADGPILPPPIYAPKTADPALISAPDPEIRTSSNRPGPLYEVGSSVADVALINSAPDPAVTSITQPTMRKIDTAEVAIIDK